MLLQTPLTNVKSVASIIHLDVNQCVKTAKSHNIINKLSDQGSGRWAAPVFCKVKLLSLSKESGCFERLADWESKAVKILKIHFNWYWFFLGQGCQTYGPWDKTGRPKSPINPTGWLCVWKLQSMKAIHSNFPIKCNKYYFWFILKFHISGYSSIL